MWPNPQETADLVTFTEEILNEKFHFLCSVDQAFNAPSHEKLESIQYNAYLALAGTIRGTSKENIYPELGLESVQFHRWYRKLC